MMAIVQGIECVRISGFISRNDERHRARQVKKHQDHLQRLKRERFGDITGHYSNIFNLAVIELSKLEKEVLSRGLEFGLP